MSWLGGSFSSLTGQLSNLTKDILTEGTEEVSDHVTELRLAQEKIKELDTVCVSQKIEIDRLKLLNREAEEKAEGSELQINRISTEYRTLLEEKEKEIKTLKHEVQELKSSYVSSETQPAVLRLDSDNGFESVSYGGDEHDFSDSIAMQHDINRLRSDLRQVQAQCQHWKELVQQQNKFGDGSVPDSKDNEAVLKKQLQELQHQLAHEKDSRQHELSALQDSQTHKLAQMRKKHKEEIAQLKAKMQEMDWGSEGWESQVPEETASLKASIAALNEEITNLKSERESNLKQITSLKESVEGYQSELSVKQAHSLHLENQLKVAKEEIKRLEEDRDQADTLEILSDLRDVRQQMDMKAIDRRNKLLLEKDKLVNQLISSNEQKKELESAVSNLTDLNDSLRNETQSLAEELGDKEQQKLTAGVMDSLEKETLVLREQNVGLQEQVALLEKALQNVNQERLTVRVSSSSDLPSGADDLMIASDSASLTSDLSEISRRNLELDEQVNTLKGQISNYETEINQFEMMQSDWLSEKEALEGVLVELRNQLKAKENSLNVAEAKKGLLAVAKHEASTSGLPDLIDPTAAIDGMGETSSNSMVEEIEPNKDSMAEIADEVVELDRKVGLLTEANAQLEQERDLLVEEKAALQKEVTTLKSTLLCQSASTTDNSKTEAGKIQKESFLNGPLKEKEMELQALVGGRDDSEENRGESPEDKLQDKEEMETLIQSQKEEIEALEKETVELKKKLRGKNEEIVNLSLEKEEMMTSLEELDNQHQEAMSHIIKIKDQVSKSNEDLKKKLAQSEAEKRSMQGEFDKLKTLNQSAESSSSNELNHQIAELKDETSDLRQKLEKSNGTIAALQKELSRKEDELNEMSDKLASSAEALNNLHMDKQELQEKVNKLKADLSSQADKLKTLKAEKEKIKQDLETSGANDSNENDESQDSSETETEQLNLQVSQLSSDLENANEQLKEKSVECKRLAGLLKKAEDMHNEFNKTIEVSDAENTTLRSKISQLEAEELSLKEKLTAASLDCEKLKEESERKTSECESFSRHIHAVENKVTTVKTELSEKIKENTQLSSQVEIHKNELSILKQKLKEKEAGYESLHKENAKVKDLLEDTADKLHSKCEECQILTEKVDQLKGELEESVNSVENEYEAQLLSATGELVLVKEELASRTEEWEKLDNELYLKDEEISKLKEGKSAMQKEIEHLKVEFDHVKEASETNSKEAYELVLQEKQVQIDTLTAECSRLKSERTSLDQKTTDQKQHYENYIKELKSVSETDSSDHQTQFNELLEKSHKKDLQISENESKLSNIYAQLQDCQKELETLEEKNQDLQTDCDAYIQEISKLKKLVEKLSSENESMLKSVKEQELTEAELNSVQEELDAVKTEKLSLESEIQNSNSQKCKILEESKIEKDLLNSQIKELQNELNSLKQGEYGNQNTQDQLERERESLKERVSYLETELEKNKQLIKDQEAGIADLNQKRADLLQELNKDSEKIKSQDGIIEVLKHNAVQKEDEITLLTRKLNRAKSFIDEEQIIQVESAGNNSVPQYNLPALEYIHKSEVQKPEVEEKIVKVETQKMLGMQTPNGDLATEHTEHVHDVILEIEKLQGQLKEKDNIISELQRNNASLLKIMDSKSKSQGDNSLSEMHKLENEVRSLKTEREQMMDVLNEKSRESSNSKAEISKLMNIVAAQKTALEKLQKDNQDIIAKRSPDGDGAHLDDMQKETVKNLSRIIRDKDLEIESLTQKNATLLSVLQESSTEGAQINSLMSEKDTLVKQLAVLQGEREQMITYLNQKHQESVAYHAEVQRLTAFINTENEKNEKIKSAYEQLVPQFEDKKQSLLKAQNELINYKQKLQELEVKTGKMIQQTESGETVDKTLYDAKIQENTKLQERYQELIENVKEKETKIQNMYQQVSDMEQNFRASDSERASYKKQVDSYMFQVHGLQTEQGDLKTEITQLKQQRDSLSSEFQGLKDANHKLTLQLQDRDFEVSSLQEKSRSLTSMIQEQQGEKGQLEHVIQENETTQKHIKQLTYERDQALLGRQHTQEQNNQLLKDIQSLKEREAKLNRELNRLRQHLIQIEEGYTKEALAAEEREKDLRTRLTSAEENALHSSSAVESANQHASQQLDSLQQQLHFVSQQRDQAYLQISSLQEQNQMYSSSMTNLQMVLEEFQHEKERMVAEETERYTKEVKTLREQVNKLQADLKYTKEQLEEASDGLEAASRLSEQLDRKEEALDALREEVQIRESGLKVVEDELRNLKSRNDDRVDKLVIKNLFLGYFTAPQNSKHEVLRAIGGVLQFSSEDFEKIDGKHSGGGWVPGFLRFSGGQKTSSPPTTPVRRSTIGATPSKPVDNSFSQMFVKFLERESSPPPPTVRLPAEEMVRDVQKQKETHKPAYNPFTAPRHVAMPTGGTPTLGTPNTQHLLMSSTVSVSQTLPTFAAPTESSKTPPGSGRNTPASTTSGAILKDVLNR
ncbi:thyroid receptor-interacting protein 11-like isoform X2 [Ruditapes philippinarum]|uniref:thyroid receptor-interacting protein 11-like isoform X2 n=1 Tax=Ruditapes philippinarum TaxID=129788 RepID=UPI00295B3E38|nr:thyroid receptor-interacting protein 11-like isoform X2 [Ruditapes philippinarum]